MLTIEHLTICYSPSNPVLEDISFSAQPGESIAILGANGSGKTSLLLALTGLIPSEGTIELNDIHLSPKTLKQFRQNIGFVFQNPDDQMFCSTIYDDFAFGLQNMGLPENEIKERVDTCLDKFGLMSKSEYCAQNLSGGEKRLAALGTVLVMNPKLLLLDEPTSFLDRNARIQLETALQATDQTKLIVTHDIHFAARMCQRVILLGNHNIQADGLASELLHNAQLLNRFGVDAIDE